MSEAGEGEISSLKCFTPQHGMAAPRWKKEEGKEEGTEEGGGVRKHGEL